MNYETTAWISFQDHGVFLGNTLSKDFDKITKVIHSFLEYEVDLKEFYNNELGINSPIDILKLADNEQILKELVWFNFLEVTQPDKHESKEWLITKQLTQNIKPISSNKGMTPYKSLNRVCFSPKINSMDVNDICLWSLIKEDETTEFSIGNYKGSSLKSGSKEEIIAEFKKILEKHIIWLHPKINNIMKLLSYTFFLITLISCNAQNPISIDVSKVDQIEVYKGYPGTKIKMKDGFEKEFILDLNKSKNLGPTKYMKSHRVLIYHKNGEIDTLLTNGTIHQFNGWSKTQINLIEKYSEPENINVSTH